MGLGGGSAPKLPDPQPVTPVPQDDDPKLLESKRKAAIAAAGREGYSAHLLSNSGQDTAMGADPLEGKTAKPANQASLMG